MTTAAAAAVPPPVKSQALHNFSLPFLKWSGSEPEFEPESRAHNLRSRSARNRFAPLPFSLKPWNLRPRKPPSVDIGTVPSTTNNAADSNDAPKPLRHSHTQKRKFWIALSREEIEEDIFLMTGSRPARRPTKRPKNVQKHIDTVFPGLWLVGITADAYRLPDTPSKS